MSMSDQEKSKAYQSIKHRLFIISLTMDILGLVVLFFFGLSGFLKGFASEINHNYYGVVFFYFLFLSIAAYLINLPLSIYSGFILEHKFGLSRENLFAWFKKDIKKLFFSLLFSLILGLALYFFLRNKAYWWIWFATFYFSFSVFLTFILPIVILPLFYKYKKINDEALKAKIMVLADKLKLKVSNIYSIDFSKESTKANAAVIGLGSTKRIVFTDTLLNNYSHEEIISVLAHEFGHAVKKHMLKILFFSFFLSFSALYLLNIGLSAVFSYYGIAISDVVGFPLFALGILILSVILMPIQNGYSRVLENEADLFALSNCSKEAFISMMEKLSIQNLADKNPGKFIEFMLYDHPPISKRINLAKEFKNE